MVNIPKKLLIIPSWYPCSEDKINGSFFQEQARLVSDCFDTKVLFFRFMSRPSVVALLKTPLQTTMQWIRFILQRKSRVRLSEDDVFINPPLIEFRARILGLTKRRRYFKRIEAYLKTFDEMMANGWRPNLIHAHSVNLAGLVAKRIKEVYGIPYIITEHMPFALSNYPEYMRDDIKIAFKNADLVLSLGYDKVRQLAISDIDVDPNLIFNFVDESLFNKLSVGYKPSQPLRLVTIGAASHYKDHRTLLRAMVILKKRGVPYTLTLIGLSVWGNLYEEILEFIKRNDLVSEVVLIDCIDRLEVSNCLAAQHVFLMTSVQEGFPVSVLEALACGLYVVATRHGGTEDILTSEMGSLVEIKNFYKIADRLEDIYYGRITFEPLRIRQSIVAICGKDAFKARLVNYYEQVLRKIV